MRRLHAGPILFSALLVAAANLGACTDEADVVCRVGADCASGICLGNGTCAAADAGDSVGSDSASEVADPDAAPSEVAADTTPADTIALDTTTPETTPGLCTPVADGAISRAEVPLRAGLYATFRVASDAAVDLVGTRDGDARGWDLTGPYNGDADVRVELTPILGSWFAADYPGATYAARLSTENDYLGVFELGADALLLRGVVSTEGGALVTNLAYDPPVVIQRYPLAQGDSWTTSANVTGTTFGVPTFASEDYTNVVDAAGSLVTPFGTFDVLRVTTTLVRTVGFVPTTTRQVAFVSPCFGTVALAVSNPGESASEFQTAAELRRLAP